MRAAAKAASGPVSGRPGHPGLSYWAGGRARPHVGQRVDAAALARYDDRVDDRGTVAGVGVADEPEGRVLFADGRGPDSDFSIKLLSSWVQPLLAMGDQGVPLVEQVLAGLPKRRLRPRAPSEQDGGFPEEPKRELKVALAQPGSLARLNPVAFIPFVLHMVKIADQAQHVSGRAPGPYPRPRGSRDERCAKTPYDPDDSRC